MLEPHNIEFITIPSEDINLIKPLWIKLRVHHADISPHFKEKYNNNSFNKRKEEFLSKLEKGSLHIDLVKDKTNNSTIGYCISSINDEKGEIDSIYVDENYRSQGIGQNLIKRSLKWIQEKGPSDIQIVIAVGNEEILPFYQEFNFFPRHLILENKE